MAFQKPDPLPTLGNHEEAILYFIAKMDIEMIDDLLDNDRLFQDLPKWQFINRLGNFFDRFRQADDTHLLIFPGNCSGKSCDNYKRSGYGFYGNESKNYFNLIVETNEENHILNLFECYVFHLTFKPRFPIGSCFYLERFFEDDDPPF